MTCNKSICDVYRIFETGEYATICLAIWQRTALSGPNRVVYGGEILVHSSFGNFSHSWNSCAVPFKQFLVDIGFHSFMSKCLGDSYLEFDGLATVAAVKRDILKLRRKSAITAEYARDLWDDIEANSDTASVSADCFGMALANVSDSDSALGSAVDYVVQRNSSQAEGFWRELWPSFKATLEAEIAKETKTAAKAA